MEEKRCIICNKPYSYHYNMFGRGCLDNMYSLLGFSKPIGIFNKENYLCTKIAWRNHKFFLNKNKKRELAKKYIALKYLNKMNYSSLHSISESIEKDINGISAFSRNIPNTVSFNLNDVYNMFNISQKFNNKIKEIQDIDWKSIDKKTAKIFLESVKFIFDVNKITSPISYVVFYSMQYVFWQVVVIGGMLTDKPLSAKLLSNSLTILGKQPEDLIIDDIKIINTMKENETVKKKIKELIEKYGEKVGKVNINDYDNPDTLIRFAGGDFLYALHDATIFIKAERNKNDTWNIEIEINDTYDFTDFKDLREYADNKESVLADIFSTLLNNFAVISSEYGVIETYNVKISFDFNNYIIE